MALQLAEPFTHTAGFGGLCAVVAAVLATIAALITVTQRTRADNRAAWWTRFTWVVDRIGTDLTGPLAVEMLDQLASTAEDLHDPRLVEFVQAYAQHVIDDILSPSPILPGAGDTGPDDGEET